jgi:UDP-glucose 4-epimerase
MKRVCITGGGGFLGLWLARHLLAQGVAVRVMDTQPAGELATRILGAHLAQVQWMQGDITLAENVSAALQGCDAVAHLAGVLTPNCQSDPVRGAQINLIGSLHVFHAALAQRLSHVVYASSAGVYGPDHIDHPEPATHYGAFKLAVEGSARAYWHDHGLASVGFRPFVVYGAGRETGGSAAPSLACKAAVEGQAYDMPMSGSTGLVHVDDVVAMFAHALAHKPAGPLTFNLVGEKASMEQVREIIREHKPHAQIGITGAPLRISADLAEEGLHDYWPERPRTGLREGIARTLAVYQSWA